WPRTEKTPPISRNVAALQEALRLSGRDIRRNSARGLRPGTVTRTIRWGRRREIRPHGTSANQSRHHSGDGIARKRARRVTQPATPSMPIDFTPQLKHITESAVTPRRVQPHFLHPPQRPANTSADSHESPIVMH